MKQIFTLIVAGLLCHAANAQLLLNEVYTDPGNGKHEFFELYNSVPFPEETDNYTIVAFYKTTTQKGFYVLDLPAATVPGKGYYVGSSASPFNYQGVANSTNTSFNWNDPTYLANNGGSLTKWQSNGGVDQNTGDGNVNYDYSKIVTTNDFFFRNGGSGTSFVVFLYKNGEIVNSALLGSGGNDGISAEILAMPPLFVDMQGSSPDFTVDFSTYTNLAVENVGQEAGSDNGFIRKFDGACGAWTKSSSQVNHTPLSTNGQMSIYTEGSVSLSGAIIIGSENAGSYLSYNVGSAPSYMLPLEIDIYVDKGNLFNQLDEQDSLLTTQLVTSTNTNYTLNFKPFDRNIVFVVRTAAGCIDHTRMIANAFMSTLPLKLLQFNAYMQQEKAIFGWSVANNEDGKYYELQSSTDRVKFQSVAVINSTSKNGVETYAYKNTSTTGTDLYYRLKMVDKNNHANFSNVVKLTELGLGSSNAIQLLQNPVSSQLIFTSSTDRDSKVSVNVYSMVGAKVVASSLYVKKGLQSNTISLDGKLLPGSYLLEVVNGTERNTVKFIKN